MSHSLTIIGVDCAVDENNTGLSLGELLNDTLVIRDVTIASKDNPPSAIITRWLLDNSPALLAFDAPLGWPVAMGSELTRHKAGQPIGCNANNLFSRETDRFIHKEFKKKPLDVGADRIARTAHKALIILDELRKNTRKDIPLIWEPEALTEMGVIEVYPVATLMSLKIEFSGYKNNNISLSERRAIRRRILESMHNNSPKLDMSDSLIEKLLSNDNQFDSAICTLAGAHFARSECISPTNLETSAKEGWIWVRRKT